MRVLCPVSEIAQWNRARQSSDFEEDLTAHFKLGNKGGWLLKTRSQPIR